MPEIRYICLSDMHFGAENSLLTDLGVDGKAQPGRPSPVLRRLVDCLRELISKNNPDPKPKLVLNGDILEFALAQDNDAAMTFQRFIELTMLDGEPLFGGILYNPGNHDHHLWETARETQFAEYVKTLSWDKRIEPAWHVTPIFRDPVVSYFFNSLLKRRPELEKLQIDTAYPNFGLLSPDLHKGIVFHHGHLTEELYYLMSILKTMLFPGSRVPNDVWGIEAENFAWIDFFWSTLGRSSDAGVGVGRVYEKLQDDKQVKQLLDNLANGLTEKFGSSDWLTNEMEAAVLKKALGAIAAIERHNTGEDLSQSSLDRLLNYLNLPLKGHIVKEQGFAPDKLTFVFGHTHKPLESVNVVEAYREPVVIYNSGGWVVDHVERQDRFGGAVILVDENFDVVSVRMYNEKARDADYAVSVVEKVRDTESSTQFYSTINDLVDPVADPWKSFSTTVASEVELRAAYLQQRIGA